MRMTLEPVQGAYIIFFCKGNFSGPFHREDAVLHWDRRTRKPRQLYVVQHYYILDEVSKREEISGGNGGCLQREESKLYNDKCTHTSDLDSVKTVWRRASMG
jgi:hypothetical protein